MIVVVVVAVADHGHEPVEDDELERELDGVRERLGAGLVDPLAAVSLDDKGDVEDDAEHGDEDQEPTRLLGLAADDGLDDLERGADVDDRDDALLHREDDELDALVHAVHLGPVARLGLVAAEGQDRRDDLEDDKVEDDHDEDGAQQPLVAHDEMQARVQHQTLARHHAPPPERGEGGVDGPGDPGPPLEDDAERVQLDAGGGDEQRPEVQRVAPLERVEHLEVDDEALVHGNAEHAHEQGGPGCVLGQRALEDAPVIVGPP